MARNGARLFGRGPGPAGSALLQLFHCLICPFSPRVHSEEIPHLSWRRRWRTAPYYHLGPSDSSQVLRLNILLTTLRLFLAFLACGRPLSCFSSEVCRQRDVSHELPQLTFPHSNGRYRLCPSLYTFHSYQRFFPLWHARPKHTCNS